MNIAEIIPTNGQVEIPIIIERNAAANPITGFAKKLHKYAPNPAEDTISSMFNPLQQETHVFSSGEHSSINPEHPDLENADEIESRKNKEVDLGDVHFPFSQYPEQQSAVVVHTEVEHAHLESRHGAPQQSSDVEQSEPLKH